MSMQISRATHPMASSSRLKSFWHVRTVLLIMLPPIFLGLGVAFAVVALRGELTNSKIKVLKSNHDIDVAPDATPELLLARIEFLLAHGRVEEVQPYAEALDKSGAHELSAIAHYDFANSRLRQAFDFLTEGKLDQAGPVVILSRQEYRHALTLMPDDWDAKFNLDVASRLIRDFPSFERSAGDTVKIDRSKIWTDIPGKPEGLP